MNLGCGGESEASKSKNPLDLGLTLSPAFPIVATLVYAAGGSFEEGSDFWSVLAAGIIISGAALIVGTLLGFLFAIPRMREKAGAEAAVVPNTNLNEISDWLTKILVGLGLVQLGKVTGGVKSMAEAAAPALGGTNEAMTFATGLLVFSAVDGFLFGYLWTRFVLSPRFKESIEENAAPKDMFTPLPEPPPVLLPPSEAKYGSPPDPGVE
ncbi:MAG TPA: hypothetical protein VN522_11975 [Solirubrobacterales bacterium]|nr:hypothetical protein [Solirubrobacterales bacterium]